MTSSCSEARQQRECCHHRRASPRPRHPTLAQAHWEYDQLKLKYLNINHRRVICQVCPINAAVTRYLMVGTSSGLNESASRALKGTHTRPVLGWMQNGLFSKWLRPLLTLMSSLGYDNCRAISWRSKGRSPFLKSTYKAMINCNKK